MSIANDAFQGGRGHLYDFPMYISLISPMLLICLSMSDHHSVWSMIWIPQLLRSNFYLQMDSLVGRSIEEVNIYT